MKYKTLQEPICYDIEKMKGAESAKRLGLIWHIIRRQGWGVWKVRLRHLGVRLGSFAHTSFGHKGDRRMFEV